MLTNDKLARAQFGAIPTSLLRNFTKRSVGAAVGEVRQSPYYPIAGHSFIRNHAKYATGLLNGMLIDEDDTNRHYYFQDQSSAATLRQVLAQRHTSDRIIADVSDDWDIMYDLFRDRDGDYQRAKKLIKTYRLQLDSERRVCGVCHNYRSYCREDKEKEEADDCKEKEQDAVDTVSFRFCKLCGVFSHLECGTTSCYICPVCFQ
eukprot:846491_1